MVLPALLTLAGYGAQAYGSGERSSAQQGAQAGYQQWLNRNNQVQNAQDQQLQAYLKQIQGSYGQDVQNLVGQFEPAQRVGAYNAGAATQRNGIQTVLDSVNGQHSPYVQGASGLFANAQTAEAARVAQANQPVVNAAAMSGGLTAMGERDARLGADFGDKARGYNAKILDAMRLYQLGNAQRNQALARAGMQNQLDQQNAMQAGNGAMLVGGLLNAGGQAYGAYQANQSTAADPSFNDTPTGYTEGSGQAPIFYGAH